MARIIKGDTPDAMAVSRAAALKLTDFAAEARDIVLEARKDAARIVTDAQAKADELLADAERRGYDEGFKRGQADGHAEGQEAAAAHRAPAELLELARRAVDELHRATEQLPRQVLAFAVEIAEKIVGEVAGDIRSARANLVKVLELGGGYREVTILVNPSQLAALREHCREVVEAMSFRGTVHLVADESVGRGGAKLVSGQGQIDAGIATQWDAVVKALLPERQEPPAGQYQSEGRVADVTL